MNVKFGLFLFVMSCFLWLGSWQPAPAQAQSVEPWQIFTNANCVRDVALEGDYIWAATCGGVVRWNRLDGSYVKYVTSDGLISNNVYAIAVEKDGTKWFGTAQGVSQFNDEDWASYTKADGLITDQWVGAIAIDKAGNKWFGTKHGMSQFDGQTWYNHDKIDDEHQLQNIIDIEIDANNNIWSVGKFGLASFDGQVWLRHREAVEQAVFDVTIDENGTVWAAHSDGVSHLDGEEWYTEILTDRNSRKRISIEARKNTAEIWFISGDETYIYNGNSWLPRSDEAELGLTSVNSIVSDEQGRLWFGTNYGLKHLNNRHWENYLTEGELNTNSISNLDLDAAGNIWVSTPRGASVFNGTYWTNYTKNDGLPHREITKFISDQSNQVWAIEWGGGVSVFNGDTWRTYKSPEISGNDISDIEIDLKGNVWVSTSRNGLNKYDGQEWTVYTTEDGLFSNRIHDIVIDEKGQVWVQGTQFGNRGGISRGFNLLQDDTWLFYEEDELPEEYFAAKHIPVQENNRLWKRNTRFDGCLSATYDLGGAKVIDVAVDANGIKWFATNRGVARYDDTQSIIQIEGQSHMPIQSLLIEAGEPGTLYALTDEGRQSSLLLSDDFGKNWAPFAGGLPVKGSCLHSISLDQTTGVLYASTCEGLYRWENENWVQVSNEETGMVSLPFNQSDVFWATRPQGPAEVPVIFSDNGGENWQPASRYLGHKEGVAHIAPDTQNANIIYATVWSDYDESTLRRGTSNGQWEMMPGPLDDIPVGTQFVQDGASGVLYVATNDEQGQLWRTCQPSVADVNSVEWELVYDFGDQVEIDILASGWSPNGQALYANLSSTQSKGDPILHRSLDGGYTWEPLIIK